MSSLPPIALNVKNKTANIFSISVCLFEWFFFKVLTRKPINHLTMKFCGF